MFEKRFSELSNVIQNCVYSSDTLLNQNEALDLFHKMLQETKGTAFVIGNGGSAGIASHFAIDLLNALKVPAQTLYDSNVMTCISNDYGYEEVFSRPLDLLLKKEDLLICISSSGSSQNILNGAAVAKEKGSPVITLSGFEPDNPLRTLGNLNFYLPVMDYGLVEMGHFFLLHTIIDSWKFSQTKTSLAHAK
ncbi:SIS domain-containing protein [Candidatus Neptunochlamydia vexilliferae]|uniref:SIS domain-containing protein n=1 Tax=Candidatus Neptunichlamydia vexilliferae TaxID=1651774 RepID=UPI001891AFB2|nr:SIS domain-containing protein [Candidatus Neptunochlamydia vexilliferae]